MLAAYTKTPALELEKGEAKAMAEAIANVSKHYKIPGMSPEHAAIAQLCFVVAVTYGKRVPLIMAGRSASRNTMSPLQAQQAQTPKPQDAPSPEPWFAGLGQPTVQ